MSASHPQHTEPVHEEPDAWHTHTLEEGAPQVEHAARANPAVLIIVLVGLVISTVAMVLALWLYFQDYVDRQKAMRKEVVAFHDPYLAYRARSLAELGTFGWQDAEAGVLNIPIEDAKRLVIERYRAAKANED